MENFDVTQLLKKYREQKCTAEEEAALESWYLLQTELEKQPLPPVDFQSVESEIWLSITKSHEIATPRKVLMMRWAAVAATIIMISIAGLIYQKSISVEKQTAIALTEIKSGQSKAVLQLSDGQNIVLDGSEQKSITDVAGVTIHSNGNGGISYAGRELTNGRDFVAKNMVTTPRGGDYYLQLQDGTKVWLNAQSSIRFPVTFNDGKREVELTGEAYFEVEKDAMRPFLVKTRHQVIQVLGTHFNVHDYNDEPTQLTTLLEGKVTVTNLASQQRGMLFPGQQSSISKQLITVQTVDANAAIAWKQGYFKFTSEPLTAIFQQLSRWYDVEFELDEDFGSKKFSGKISRTKNIAEVLRIIETSGNMKFKTILSSNAKERRISIML